ncbi:MAG: hypothetical protein ABW278_06765 [Steroidobacteraceae bacterium]
MEPTDITFLRSLKVLWSFGWRSFVLSIVVMIPVQILSLMFVTPAMSQFQADAPPDMARVAVAMMKYTLIAFPLAMAAAITAQALAIRWMLKSARWSDFSLLMIRKTAVSPSDGTQGAGQGWPSV